MSGGYEHDIWDAYQDFNAIEGDVLKNIQALKKLFLLGLPSLRFSAFIRAFSRITNPDILMDSFFELCDDNKDSIFVSCCRNTHPIVQDLIVLMVESCVQYAAERFMTILNQQEFYELFDNFDVVRYVLRGLESIPASVELKNVFVKGVVGFALKTIEPLHRVSCRESAGLVAQSDMSDDDSSDLSPHQFHEASVLVFIRSFAGNFLSVIAKPDTFVQNSALSDARLVLDLFAESDLLLQILGEGSNFSEYARQTILDLIQHTWKIDSKRVDSKGALLLKGSVKKLLDAAAHYSDSGVWCSLLKYFADESDVFLDMELAQYMLNHTQARHLKDKHFHTGDRILYPLLQSMSVLSLYQSVNYIYSLELPQELKDVYGAFIFSDFKEHIDDALQALQDYELWLSWSAAALETMMRSSTIEQGQIIQIVKKTYALYSRSKTLPFSILAECFNMLTPNNKHELFTVSQIFQRASPEAFHFLQQHLVLRDSQYNQESGIYHCFVSLCLSHPSIALAVMGDPRIEDAEVEKLRLLVQILDAFGFIPGRETLATEVLDSILTIDPAIFSCGNSLLLRVAITQKKYVIAQALVGLGINVESADLVMHDGSINERPSAGISLDYFIKAFMQRYWPYQGGVFENRLQGYYDDDLNQLLWNNISTEPQLESERLLLLAMLLERGLKSPNNIELLQKIVKGATLTRRSAEGIEICFDHRALWLYQLLNPINVDQKYPGSSSKGVTLRSLLLEDKAITGEFETLFGQALHSKQSQYIEYVQSLLQCKGRFVGHALRDPVIIRISDQNFIFSSKSLFKPSRESEQFSDGVFDVQFFGRHPICWALLAFIKKLSGTNPVFDPLASVMMQSLQRGGTATRLLIIFFAGLVESGHFSVSKACSETQVLKDLLNQMTSPERRSTRVPFLSKAQPPASAFVAMVLLGTSVLAKTTEVFIGCFIDPQGNFNTYWHSLGKPYQAVLQHILFEHVIAGRSFQGYTEKLYESLFSVIERHEEVKRNQRIRRLRASIQQGSEVHDYDRLISGILSADILKIMGLVDDLIKICAPLMGMKHCSQLEEPSCLFMDEKLAERVRRLKVKMSLVESIVMGPGAAEAVSAQRSSALPFLASTVGVPAAGIQQSPHLGSALS